MPNSQPQFDFPEVPCPVERFLDHVEQNPTVPIRQLLQPFQAWENTLRSVFAQDPKNAIVENNTVNLVDVFANGDQDKIRIRGRKLDLESKEEREKYIMPLEEEERKSDGQFAIASSLEEFQRNFNIFTENQFQSFDWSNIVAAGSAVTTSLAPVPEAYASSVKTKREYYHQKVAPASDIDLFIYGIDDEQAAIDRMGAIEKNIRDNLLVEAIVIRTKNTVTIASQYPHRHVQIVLRLYQSISQILTGFDVNCSCVAYDGTSVFASPRALAAFMTQCNDMDLSRRSPSYESRLSKYSHRGFEVYCEFLDRSKIDPTIFERSFARTVGLARLLVLEKLPKPTDREEYIVKRRIERGGQSRNNFWKKDSRNLKLDLDDEVPEWQFGETVSGYNTFTIPYGKFPNAKKLERSFYATDILLNAEWNSHNKPPHREVKLHRHPVFLGTVAEVSQDCCGYCPIPETDEEKAVFEEENKRYVSGRMVFLKDDPGRQEIGSFHPLDADDYTEMAYISDSEVLFRAIVNNDVSKVKEWLAREDVNINCRDHCGRTPLHVAALSSDSLEIFQALIDRGARMTARLQDGRTALHIAAARGQNDFVNALLRKSEVNEEEKMEKEDKLRLTQKATGNSQQEEVKEGNSSDLVVSKSEEIDVSDSEDYAASEDCEKTSAAHSFVKIKRKEEEVSDDALAEENQDEPDILDVNALDWYFGMAPLHHAILAGSENLEMVLETLVSSFGADILLPVKKKHNPGDLDPKLILVLTLPLTLPSKDKVMSVLKTLLRIGASCAQANSANKATALHYAVALERVYPQRLSDISPAEALDVLLQVDGPAARGVLNCLATNAENYFDEATFAGCTESPLMTAIAMHDETVVLKLLQNRATAAASYQDYVMLRGRNPPPRYGFGQAESAKETWVLYVKQPLERAIRKAVDVVQPLVEAGADPSTILNESLNDKHRKGNSKRKTVLDLVQDNIKKLKQVLDNLGSSEPARLSNGVHASQYEQFPQDSYKRFYAQLRVDSHNRLLAGSNSVMLKRHKDEEEESEGLKYDIEEAISYFERTEKYLISKGAQSYYDLYPEELQEYTPYQEQMNLPEMNQQRDKVQWAVDFKFGGPNLVDNDKKEEYLELFEATWNGDVETVKRLTTEAYSNSSREPLLVATSDLPNCANLNPFIIAVLRGHMELARIIFALSQVQYVPKESTQKYRYTLDEDGTGVVKEAIVEASTIENIGFQPHIVQSETSPMTMMSNFFKLGVTVEQCHQSLMDWAIQHDKMDVVQTLLELAQAAEEDGQWRLINPVLSCPTNRYDNMCNALRLGKISILEMFIKATGCGLDYVALEHAQQENGSIKPEYYLGLTINGKKRKDWAKSVNPDGSKNETVVEKLLHITTYQGNIDSVHWLLSDRPLYCFQEFIRLHPKNKRAKVLAAQPDLAQVVQDAIGLDSEILPHLTIQGWNGKGSIAVLDFWFSKFPELLEARCDEGLTPLLHAVHCVNEKAIKYMVAKGADVQATTHDDLNFVHFACGLKGFRPSPYIDYSMKGVENAERLLSCLPEGVDIKKMIAHRASYHGELATIWHKFADIKPYLAGVEYLIHLSSGHGLDVFNGGGNLPVHHAITKGRYKLAKLYIDARPDLLHKENAGGKTAFELATDTFLGDLLTQISDPIPDKYHRYQYNFDTSVEEIINNQGINYYSLRNRYRDNFNSTEDSDYDAGQDILETRKVVLEAVQKYQGPRIRVTLNEVNELVYRLANKGKQGKGKKAVDRQLWRGKTRRGIRRNYPGDEEGLLQEWPVLNGGATEEEEEKEKKKKESEMEKKGE